MDRYAARVDNSPVFDNLPAMHILHNAYTRTLEHVQARSKHIQSSILRTIKMLILYRRAVQMLILYRRAVQVLALCQYAAQMLQNMPARKFGSVCCTNVAKCTITSIHWVFSFFCLLL